MPLLDTPDVRQRTDYSCGSGAFEILFRYHYPRKPLPAWGDLADPVRGLGTEALELFVRREFAHILAGHIDVVTLGLLTRRTPVLCLMTWGSDADHWLAVRGVSRGRVYTQDPGYGRHSYPVDEWLKMWRDTSAGGAYERFALTGWR